MDLLETHLEALAFQYSITAASSLWTWIAVLTAAVGFWRIRTVGSRPNASPPPKPTHLIPAQPEPRDPSPVVVGSPTCHVESEGTPKGRYTAYYSCCSQVEDNGEEGDGVCDGEGDVDSEEEPSWGSWGMTVRRRGDLGWYRYQDLTALNGSVVRLWDGDENLTAESRRGLKRLF